MDLNMQNEFKKLNVNHHSLPLKEKSESEKSDPRKRSKYKMHVDRCTRIQISTTEMGSYKHYSVKMNLNVGPLRSCATMPLRN